MGGWGDADARRERRTRSHSSLVGTAAAVLLSVAVAVVTSIVVRSHRTIFVGDGDDPPYAYRVTVPEGWVAVNGVSVEDWAGAPPSPGPDRRARHSERSQTTLRAFALPADGPAVSRSGVEGDVEIEGFDVVGRTTVAGDEAAVYDWHGMDPRSPSLVARHASFVHGEYEFIVVLTTPEDQLEDHEHALGELLRSWKWLE